MFTDLPSAEVAARWIMDLRGVPPGPGRIGPQVLARGLGRLFCRAIMRVTAQRPSMRHESLSRQEGCQHAMCPISDARRGRDGGCGAGGGVRRRPVPSWS
jgi:hypothetical protein